MKDKVDPKLTRSDHDDKNSEQHSNYSIVSAWLALIQYLDQPQRRYPRAKSAADDHSSLERTNVETVALLLQEALQELSKTPLTSSSIEDALQSIQKDWDDQDAENAHAICKELAHLLESVVEDLAYAWDDDVIVMESSLQTPRNHGSRNINQGASTPQHALATMIVPHILTVIAGLYAAVAWNHNPANTMTTDVLNQEDNGNGIHNDDDLEDIADSYLDWAIASKRANRIDECIHAHFRRMELIPEYKVLDAVRLLGINDQLQNGQLQTENAEPSKVEDICIDGIFKHITQPKRAACCRGDYNDDPYYYQVYCPSHSAVEIGNQVRNVFLQAKYCLEKCQRLLLAVVVSAAPSSEMTALSLEDHKDLFFSADAFFRHRRTLLQCYDTIIIGEDDDGDESFKVLAAMFLFGLGLSRRQVTKGLSAQQLEMLVQARLLRIHPMDADYIIPEVQIYPLDANTFDGGDGDHTANTTSSTTPSCPLLFMTDWNLESMRLPRDAIMSVGYDTLELISLSSGIDIFGVDSNLIGDKKDKDKQQQQSHHGQKKRRVLDLCCGCGIQGLFAAGRAVANIDTAACGDSATTTRELYCMDINRRACHFASGNMCLNGLAFSNNREDQDGSTPMISICAVWADLFQPILGPSNQNISASSQPLVSSFDPQMTIGTFDCILSNPPFVAVPTANKIPTMSPALYSAGGGMDGMGLLRRMLKDFQRVMSKNNANGSESATSPRMLMVTELPNIQESFSLLQELLSAQANGTTRCTATIRVAYVEEDVETVQDYTNEREVEAGCYIPGRNWNVSSNDDTDSAMIIYNRALALISITPITSTDDDSMQPSQDNTPNHGIAAFRGLEALAIAKRNLLAALPPHDDATGDMMEALLEEQDAFLTRPGVAFARGVLL